MKIKIKKLQSNAKIPVYMTEYAAGMDIYSCLSKPVLLQPMQRALIPTGIAIELPKGFEAQIRPRSGLAIKHGITLLNSPGTIDSDYRGEIKVILINLSDKDFLVKSNERIAQMIISRVEHLPVKEVLELSITERNRGGFGSTGVK